jgi:hypothetical protein
VSFNGRQFAHARPDAAAMSFANKPLQRGYARLVLAGRASLRRSLQAGRICYSALLAVTLRVVHVVFDFKFAQLTFEDLELAVEIDGVVHRLLAREEEPDERKPELARVRQRPAIDEHLAHARLVHEVKQLAERRRINRIKGSAMAVLRPAAGFAVLA